MVRLSVNVNKIATIRNSRGGTIPDVVEAARTCIAAGCHGITVHPRPDARHITFQDVFDLPEMLTVEFNIEGYPGARVSRPRDRVRPTQATLVPDPPGVLTSNAGWNLTERGGLAARRARSASQRRHPQQPFLETDARPNQRARELGADRIELFTGPYTHMRSALRPVERFCGALRSRAAGARNRTGRNAGHDLDLKNIPAYAKAVKGLQEEPLHRPRARRRCAPHGPDARGKGVSKGNRIEA